VLKTHLTTVDVQGTVAVRATDWLDLGVGVDAQYTKALLSNAYPNLSPLAPDGSAVLKGDGWNYGWNVGAQAHFGDVTLGASYRSAMDHDIDGSIVLGGLLGPLAGSNVSTNATANFTTPWFATLGVNWQATPQLNLHAQVQRFGWSKFDAIRLNIAGSRSALVQDYKDTTAGGVGADFDINPVWVMRAGVQYDQTPTQDDLRTPRVPDSSRYLYTIGTTWKYRPWVSFDAGMGYIAFMGGPIRHEDVFYGGTLAQTTVHTRGVGVGNGKVLSLALRWLF
jgi:long-chain fatty acid transport protein